MLKAAFIFVAEGADGQKDRSVVTTPSVELITVGVVDYAEAVVISKQLVEEGVQAIELCGGFGHLGTAKIVEAVGDKAVVGVVRFDTHPGLGNQSGDTFYL
ncbi:hypothetical protein IGI39_002017 [Enterococcus sp. AZ135]|uniref:DUF6506 family protein n=1 Tax=unclassified Enterococcus TaxID=2608891 RepID=UPI003F295008